MVLLRSIASSLTRGFRSTLLRINVERSGPKHFGQRRCSDWGISTFTLSPIRRIYARIQKLEDATAKSEDERAKLSCCANSFRIRNFTFSHLQPKGGPSGHHQHMTIYSNAKKLSDLVERSKKMLGLFFLKYIYKSIDVHIYGFVDTCIYI